MKMKLILVLVVMICFSSLCFGQIANVSDVSGKPLMVRKYQNIEGSPYLSEGKWFQGKLVLATGKELLSQSIRYNAYEDNVEFMRNESPLVLESGILKGFEFTYLDEFTGDRVVYSFQIGSAIDSKLDPRAFYRVIYLGEKLKVVEKIRVQEISVTPPAYGQSDIKKFVLNSSAMILANDKMNTIGKITKRSVLAYFDQHTKMVKQYISDKRVDFSNSYEVARLFRFVESQVNTEM